MTVFLAEHGITACLVRTSKIDRSIPIVAETEQILNRQISPLKSRAQISDGSPRRFFVVRGKSYAAKSTHYHGAKQSSGNEGMQMVAVASSRRRISLPVYLPPSCLFLTPQGCLFSLTKLADPICAQSREDVSAFSEWTGSSVE
jgi:hypothetical protein